MTDESRATTVVLAALTALLFAWSSNPAVAAVFAS